MSSDENEECELLTDEGFSLISVSDVESLLKKALLSANLAENMCQIIGNSPKFSYRMMPFMLMCQTCIFEVQTWRYVEMNVWINNILNGFQIY